MTSAYLGIDVGGTASRWVVVSESGLEIARGKAGGATGHLFNPVEHDRFGRILADIAAALPEGTVVHGVHAGVTGLGENAAAEAQGLLARQFDVWGERVTTSDDMEVAFRAVFPPGGGHLVSAGTGSIGLHLTAHGEQIRVGGRGLLIDDAGSGTWIALTALDRLYRLIDRVGEPRGAELLAEAIGAAVGGPNWDHVRQFVYGSDRGRIGTLAQPVATAASAGDPLAQTVLADAARELARLAQALLERAGALPVGFVGGIIDLHPLIRAGLVEALPGVDLSFRRVDAALHAAQMARAHNSRPADGQH